MSNKLLLAPPSAHPTSHTTHPTGTFSAPSAPGVYDTLRASLNPYQAASSSSLSRTQPSSSPHPHHAPLQLQSSHPLEPRLRGWTSTQHSLRQNLARRQYGLAAPLARELALMTVRHGDEVRPAAVLAGQGGLGSVHEEILMGNDWDISWEDVFAGGEELRALPDFHAEMEWKMGMGW